MSERFRKMDEKKMESIVSNSESTNVFLKEDSQREKDDKEPWMSGYTVANNWVPFEDLDVLGTRKGCLWTITKTSIPLDFGEDKTTNVRASRFYGAMANMSSVDPIVVVDVAELIPNNEDVRFDPEFWFSWINAGTVYAVRKAFHFELVRGVSSEKNDLEEDSQREKDDKESIIDELDRAKAQSADKEPWMGGCKVPNNWVPFQELDVLGIRKQCPWSITKTSIALEFSEDSTTNVRASHFCRAIANVDFVDPIVVVDVAELIPNNEDVRFDPAFWFSWRFGGTEYAARKLFQSYFTPGCSYHVVQQINFTAPPGDSAIEELAGIDLLQELHLKNLQNLRGRKGAERAKLVDRQYLEYLVLYWVPNSDHDDDDVCSGRSLNDEMVLEGLQPHPNSKKLAIHGFQGLKLPKWIMIGSMLPKLVELHLFECNSCEQLPSLGMLPCLMVLKIKGLHSVKCLGKEFYYQQEEEKEIQATKSSSLSSRVYMFPSLVELSLIDMSVLKEWVVPLPHSFSSFPSLESLIVRGCSRLKSIPLASCASLKSLELCNTNDEAVNSVLGSRGGEHLTYLTSISIKDSPQLVFFPVLLLQNDTRIESLEIANCSGFQGFRILNNDSYYKETLSSDTGFSHTSISSLSLLKLIDCPALKSLPDSRNWTCLTKLWIEDCDKLKKSFPYGLSSLHNLEALYVDGAIDLSDK